MKKTCITGSVHHNELQSQNVVPTQREISFIFSEASHIRRSKQSKTQSTCSTGSNKQKEISHHLCGVLAHSDELRCVEMTPAAATHTVEPSDTTKHTHTFCTLRCRSAVERLPVSDGSLTVCVPCPQLITTAKHQRKQFPGLH